MKRILFFFSLLLFFASVNSTAQQEARLLRFPTIYDNQVVFTHAGNLYTVPISGGIARKLTNDIGVEIFPRFSHDGKWIAFTGQYDGNTEVYVMPSQGGVPKRLTYTATLGRDDVSDRMGPNNLVMGWTHDNKNILFRSRMKEFNSFKGHLFLAPFDGSLHNQLPLPRGGFGSYSEDDSKLAYNRIFREFRTWKRYRGGMADDIWVYDFNTKETIQITDNPAQDIIPMWHKDNIYFLSDRDENFRMNLYVYNLTSKENRKLTNFTDFDIKFPSLGNNAIVFENAGYIYKFDLSTESLTKIEVKFAEDFAISRSKIEQVDDNLSNYEIAPDGKRALFGARGDVFTVPAEKGYTRNLTSSPGVHERNSKWSPDGKYIGYVSDKTGEDEIYIIPQDGSGKEIQLTDQGGSYKYGIAWSPDSKMILWTDRENKIKYVNIESKNVTTVLEHDRGRGLRASWSPDSKWLAFSLPEEVGMDKIYIYSLDEEKMYPITEGWYDSRSPIFSSDGKYLIFISGRDFNPIYSWTEWNHAYRDMNGIYLTLLSKETKSPFEPVNDEVEIKDEKKDSKDNDEKKDDKNSKPEDEDIVIDLDGIQNRILKLPIDASSYFNLGSVENKIYYQRRGSKDSKTKLLMYDLDKQKETELGEINGYEISSDNKKMIVSQNRSYAIIDLPSKKIEISDKLDLSDLKVNLDLKQEWAQIFEQAWRQMRDFFYVPNMHGVNWAGMKKQYKPLLKNVNHRIDLSYVIGEMISELNVGHAYVSGGDYPKPERIRTGLLGAEFEKDSQTGYFQIKEIIDGQNWSNSLRSPLTEIGVDAKEGDYIVEINGKATSEIKNIYSELVDKAGEQVPMKINSNPSLDGARDVLVVPISNEHPLYYYSWVQNNIKKVNEATDGKVGYIHVPDMGANGLNEFVKHFYPQLRKEALIIDVRGNGGGNVSSMLIERLNREIAMVGNMRGNPTSPDPGALILGPKVCLIDEFSASDGDIFPYRFKQYNMGKLIGKRSWGGVVGIAGSTPFVDGGSLNTPEFGLIDKDGKEWIVEGYGVEPDIVVDNDPALEYQGIDQQLNKAIEVILEDLKNYKYKLPDKPQYPEK